MRTVNIAELKTSLSTYLNFAKAGEDVIIRDRNTPVARLVPYVAVDATEEVFERVAKGLCVCRRRNGTPKHFQSFHKPGMWETPVRRRLSMTGTKAHKRGCRVLGQQHVSAIVHRAGRQYPSP